MAWIRTGFCCRCGDCCKGNPWEDPSIVEAYGGQPEPVVVEGYCPLFEWHKGAPEGEGFCVGHEPPLQDPYYLSACEAWPTEPAQIADKPSCTYRFDWRDD